MPADLAAWEPGVPDDAAAVTNRVALFQALLSLPARQRATVVLRYLEGMSERETAAILGCGEGTVKKPDIPGARLAPDLSRTRGDTTMNSQLERQLGENLRGLAASPP